MSHMLADAITGTGLRWVNGAPQQLGLGWTTQRTAKAGLCQHKPKKDMLLPSDSTKHRPFFAYPANWLLIDEAFFYLVVASSVEIVVQPILPPVFVTTQDLFGSCAIGRGGLPRCGMTSIIRSSCLTSAASAAGN